MTTQIPTPLQPAFKRSQHPFLMWDGILSISQGVKEILDQPVRQEIESAAEAVTGKGPIHLIGAGTSYFTAIASVFMFQTLAEMQAFPYNAFEFSAYPPPGLANQTVIGISHTGGTPAVVEGVRYAREQGAVTVGYTDVGASALASVTQHVISGALGAEPALPKTRSYLAALTRSARLAIEVGKRKGKNIVRYEEELQAAPERCDQILQSTEEQVRSIVKNYPQTNRIVVVGGGPSWATALEGSLKITEAALVHSTPWELEEAVHGTWASTRSGDLIIILAMDGPSYEKAVKLAQGMKMIEVDTWVITNRPEQVEGATHTTRIDASGSEIFTPLFAVLPLYQFAYFLALERNIHPDIMRLDDSRYLQARTLLRQSVSPSGV